MGGERETVAEQRVETPTGETEVIGSVRYHESKGQIHFHDDANNLKVAIPVATWFRGWQHLLTGVPSEWNFVDVERNTLLHVQLAVKEAKPKKGRLKPRIDALLSISEVESTDEFSKLVKFSAK